MTVPSQPSDAESHEAELRDSAQFHSPEVSHRDSSAAHYETRGQVQSAYMHDRPPPMPQTTQQDTSPPSSHDDKTSAPGGGQAFWPRWQDPSSFRSGKSFVIRNH